jgi:RNA polymerase sigma-70 factor (ECF subfamily)
VNEQEMDISELDRLRRCDHDAFASLVEQHQRLVLSLGQSMGFAGADLDEAAAEVFAGIYLALPSFQSRSSLKTWIYRIAIRTFGKLRERRAAKSTISIETDSPDAAQADPATRMECEESNQQLWNAVAALDSRAAAMVELHYRHEWPLPQIAEVMECPVGTVKTVLFRAREQLKRALSAREISL